MFDPRTLPNGDLTFNLACFFWYAAMLADVVVTRIGIWGHGQVESNRLMAWFTDKAHPFRTFLDAGVLRPALVLPFLTFASWSGYVDKSHSYLPFGLAAATVTLPIRNWLKLKK